MTNLSPRHTSLSHDNNIVQSASAQITILIVDDCPLDRNVYRRYLEIEKNYRYSFFEAKSLEQGLTLWRSHHPDIVLVDYLLPDGNGLQLLTAIGEEYEENNLDPKLGAIMLTRCGDEQIAVQAMKLGAADYLIKDSLTPVKLRSRVAQVCDRIKLTRQLQRARQQEILVTDIALRIRQYLELEEILSTVVTEVRTFLNSDRAIIYKFNPDMSGTIISESIVQPWSSCLNIQVEDSCFRYNLGGTYREGRVFATSDIYTANLTGCHLQLMENFQVRANLVIPILLPNNNAPLLWGLLIIHQCSGPRFWEDTDIHLLQQLSVQLAIAIQQAELYQNLQDLNISLEEEIEDRRKAEVQLLQAKAQLEIRVAKRTAELYQRQQEFIALIENSPNVIIRLDHQMHYLYVNPAIERITGMSPKEFVGKTGREMDFPKTNLDKLEATIRRVLATGEEQRCEAQYPLPNSQGMGYYQAHFIPEFSPDGEVETVLLIFYDITSNKRSEIALTESNRRWQSLIDNVRLLVVGLSYDGKIEYANPFFLDSTGYQLEEVLGKDWFANFIPQHEQELVQHAFSELLANTFQYHHQSSILTKANEERAIAWNNTLLLDKDGEVIGTLSIGEDITDKLHIERVKSEFVSIVSHELRTPLSSIRGALGLLASGVLADKPEVAQHMLEIASFDTERLVRLVSDMLDLERLESNTVSLSRQWCNVDDLCQHAIETMKAIADENQIQLLYKSKSLQTWADSDRIEQTLINLISNAIKFSPPHNDVLITVEAQEDAILFRVCDRGRGIPANRLENIFERFNQVDASDSRQKGGTGLGLAICRSIVQQHGGKIWVESVVNQGSTFSFTIPHRISSV